MRKFRLYAFSEPSGERECVVISDEEFADVCQEYGEPHGRQLDNVLDIDGNAIGFPCDRELVHKLH